MEAALAASWANTSAAGCLALPTMDQQVACSAQQLNITDPPRQDKMLQVSKDRHIMKTDSMYDWTSASFLWTPVTCLLANVTYGTRMDQPGSFNFCTVPQQGNDAFLFAALALLAGACALGKLAVVWVLIAGGALGAASYWANLRELGNGVALWLGISPPDLFFYAFIPPLAVDSALRLDFFLFRKTWPHMLLTAFLMVIASAFLLTPIILFAMGFQSRGFNWAHVALFSAMVASTDALSVTAILKKTGGPARLVTLIEGESLLNDASAITLFEVFKSILEANADPTQPFPSVTSSLPTIVVDTLRLAGIGAAVGLAISMALGYLLRWLRWHGMQPSAESVAVLACSFLSFYVANAPAGGSGVIAVVVFGLWGNYTRKWGMLAASEESGDFNAFWDALSVGANGLVFFWSGCSCLNFLIRSAGILSGSAWSWGAIPLIYVLLVLLRAGFFALFNVSIFRWLKEVLSWPEVLFSGWAGLRGSVSLIMIADLLTNSSQQLTGGAAGEEQSVVYAEITLWTSTFVLLTLVINAPTLAPLVRLLGLNSAAKMRQPARARAKRALCRFTDGTIRELQEKEGELQGANWDAVAHYCDPSHGFKCLDPPPSKAKAIDRTAGGPAAGAGDAAPSAGGDTGLGGVDGHNIMEEYDAAPDADAILAEVEHGVPFLDPALRPRPSSGGPAEAVGASGAEQEDLEAGIGANDSLHAGKVASEIEEDMIYYSTVPSTTGTALQRELQHALHAAPQQAQQAPLPVGGQLSGAAAGSGSTPTSPGSGWNSASQTLQATSGRRLQQQLAAQLAALRRAQEQGGASSSGPASPRAPASGRPPRPATVPHGFTLSGAAGASLAAELQRQLANTGHEGVHSTASRVTGSAALPQRDLLGRRLNRTPSDSPRGMPPKPPLSSQHRTVTMLTDDSAASSGGAAVPPAPGDSFRLPAALADASPLATRMELRRVQTFAARAASGTTPPPPPERLAWQLATDGSRAGGSSGDLFGLPCSDGLTPQMPELRLGLLAGLERACQARRMQGLLSAQGLRTLEYCFAKAAEHPEEPLHVWDQHLSQEVKGGWTIRLAARLLLATARGYAALPILVQRAASWPFRKLSGLLRRQLGASMLASCEAVIEYGLALTSGAHLSLAAAAQHPHLAEQLQQEVDSEAKAVERYIADREVEAPDTFQAIQSYRAAMAVLQRQRGHAWELYQLGALDSGERDDVLEELGTRARQLELTGPVWKPPRPGAVLRSMPFLRCLPRARLERLLAKGSLKELPTGMVFWRGGASAPASQGIYVVLAGAVHRRLLRPDGGEPEEFFQNSGGVVGALPAVAGTSLPGSEVAEAQGNSLGRGPLVFHLPQAALEQLLDEGRAGKPAAAQSRLELLRLAASRVLESCDAVELRLDGPHPLGKAGALSTAGAAPIGSASQLAAYMQSLGAQEVEEEALGDGAGGASTPRPEPTAVLRTLALHATAVMRGGLHSALLLELPPGAPFRQTTHAVLLQGRLAAITVEPPVTAPRALPWLADPLLRLHTGQRERRWQAGPQGAALLVWLTAAGEEPVAVADAARAAASEAVTYGRQAVLRQSHDDSGAQPGGGSLRRLRPWQHPLRHSPARQGS